MVRKISLIIITMLYISFNGLCYAQSEGGRIESEPIATSMTIRGSSIHIQHATGSVLEIFSLTGSKVATYKIDNDDKQIDLSLRKGCYIIKLGQTVRKITIP